MTLEEAIKHCEDVAENKEQAVYDLLAFGYSTKEERNECIECANEHRQLAEWLTELKERRKNDRHCKGCLCEFKRSKKNEIHN